jgi:CBS-domain-containing membrane protein
MHYQFFRFLLDRHDGLLLNDKARTSDTLLHSLGQKEEMQVCSVTIYMDERLKQVVARMFKHKCHYFCVLNKKGQVIHIFDEKDILNGYFTKNNPYQTVRELLVS